MKRIVVLPLMAVSIQVFAEEIYLGAKEVKTIDAQTDVVQSDTVVVSSDATLAKKGEGVLTVKTGALAQDWKASIAVSEGVLKLQGSVSDAHSFYNHIWLGSFDI